MSGIVLFGLGMVVHLCNFDWLVKKAQMLPHSARLTCVAQNCISNLNLPGVILILKCEIEVFNHIDVFNEVRKK